MFSRITQFADAEGAHAEPCPQPGGTALDASEAAHALPSLEEIQAARRTVAAALPRTPLHAYPALSRALGFDRLGVTLRIKHENHHALGSFKVRGGVHLAATLAAETTGLWTASTGNHGQSIACAGQLAQVPVVVAVPVGSNPAKIAAMRALGAQVVEHGRDIDAARAWAKMAARAHGGRYISPTEPELIAGVASLHLEILEDCPDADVVIVPVGSGSNAAAACLVRSALKPALEVVGVQSNAAPAAWRSWRAKAHVEAPMRSRAEGVATGAPYPNAQRVMQDAQRGLNDFVLVSDAAMERGIATLARTAHTLAEHAGAAPVAAAEALGARLWDRVVVLVLTGGNLAPAALGLACA